MIKEGAKVLYSSVDGSKTVGTVTKVYDFNGEDDPVYAVALETGLTMKTIGQQLEEIKEIKDPKESDKITISREEYRSNVFKLSEEEGKKNAEQMLCLAFMIFAAKLERKLFGDPENG